MSPTRPLPPPALPRPTAQASRVQPRPVDPQAPAEAAQPSAVAESVRTIRGAPQARDGFEGALSRTAGRAWEDLARSDVGTRQALLPDSISNLVRKLDLKAARSLLEMLFPPKFEDQRGQAYLAATEDFRTALADTRAAAATLASLPDGDPGAPAAKKAFEAAEAKLRARSGYTLDSVPEAGALWVDPQFMGDTLGNGAPRPQRSRMQPPVDRPPEPMELLFGKSAGPARRSYTFDCGTTALQPELRTANGVEAYKSEVARNRAAAGLPEQGGEPIGIHATFQGGGGKGKRYAPALMELMQQGVVPVSASGASVGAIAAAIVAAGADPAQLGAFVTDPRIQGFFDLDLSQNDGGLMNGNVAYDVLDDELRKLTGITDRPVTFRDLPMPLRVYAAKTSDSDPAAGDMTRVEDRLFEFSQETTPDTPVALAVRASMAIPGLYDPVQMVDPTTGRHVTLVDGGALDNLPMLGNPTGLPEVGFTLAERNSNHPESAANNAARGPLPAGNLEAGDILWNAFNGWDLMQSGGGSADDFRDRTQPKAGQFMLSVPTWNLEDPSQGNDLLGFGYDAELDPILDSQTREVTRAALKNWLPVLTDPKARGTNVIAELPDQVQFSTPVEVGGKRYTAHYAGGDKVSLVDEAGKKKDVKLGEERIESIWLDDQAYGDLAAQLEHELSGKMGGGLFDWFR